MKQPPITTFTSSTILFYKTTLSLLIPFLLIYTLNTHSTGLPPAKEFATEEAKALTSNIVSASDYDFSRLLGNQTAYEILGNWIKEESLDRSDNTSTINEKHFCEKTRQVIDTHINLSLLMRSDSLDGYNKVKSDFHISTQAVLTNSPEVTAEFNFGDKASIDKLIKELADIDQYWEKQNLTLSTDKALIGKDIHDPLRLTLEQARCQAKYTASVAINAIVNNLGWPTAAKGYSEKTSDNLWLLVQHQDYDLPLQVRVLDIFEKHLQDDEIDGESYAYLFDRVAMNTGKPQRYGTQFECKNGKAHAKPIEQPDTINERRLELGLTTLTEYHEFANKHLCRLKAGQ